MAGESAKVMDQLVAAVESATPITRWDDSLSFRHERESLDGETLSTRRGITRRFVVSITGDRTIGGPIYQATEPFRVVQVFDLAISYAIGRDLYALQKVIAEDMDTVSHTLMSYANWNPNTTGIVRLETTSYDLTAVGDEGMVGSMLVTLPVEVEYVPTF